MILPDKILKLGDTEFHESNFLLLSNTHKKNGYSEKLINSTIKRTWEEVKYSKHNALCEHIINLEPDRDNVVNWDGVTILHKEAKQLCRCDGNDILKQHVIPNKQIECK